MKKFADSGYQCSADSYVDYGIFEKWNLESWGVLFSIYLYENLYKEIEDNYFDDAKKQIEKEKEKAVAQNIS